MSRLTNLCSDMSQNSFDGDFPNKLLDFPFLERISLAALVLDDGFPNGFSGSIQDKFHNLPQLTMLYVFISENILFSRY